MVVSTKLAVVFVGMSGCLYDLKSDNISAYLEIAFHRI